MNNNKLDCEDCKQVFLYTFSKWEIFDKNRR